jgi:hypothetical protein
MRSVRAPGWPAWLGFALATVAAGLLVWREVFVVGIAGYVLASLIAPSFVVVFRVLERRASRSLAYVRRSGLARIARITLVIALFAGALHAWFIATELAKR